MAEKHFWNSLVAGGCAGLSVDLALFPLDTVKTRLQSKQGFLRSGGFRGIYAGLPSVAVGSVPGAAAFFCTYELMKNFLAPYTQNSTTLQTSSHMVAASCGEIMACLIRVPCEVIKQRTQTASHRSSLDNLKSAWSAEGMRGLYRGYFSTLAREIPFSLIQFPLWEYLKATWSLRQGMPVDPWQGSLAGALSGAIGAALTTPLDVAKTRIMLAQVGTTEASGGIFSTLSIVFAEKGLKGLFAGVVPRVMWISIGGAIFLGMYEKVNVLLE